MKKNLLIATAVLALLTFANIAAKAQHAAINSSNIPLSIILADAVSITVEASPAVSFSYANPADYIGSRTENKPTHFSIFSNRKYTLSVHADAVFPPPSAGPTIPLSAVTVGVASATPAATGATPTTVALSIGGGNILTPAPATLGTSFSIDYTIPSATPLLGVTAGTYTTNVIYTVTQL